jgi:PAS domain-containing protein
LPDAFAFRTIGTAFLQPPTIKAVDWNQEIMNIGNQKELAAARASEMAAELAERENTAQLRAILDLTPDGYVAFDTDYRVRYVNPGFAHLTGLDAAASLGLSESALASCLPRVASADHLAAGPRAPVRRRDACSPEALPTPVIGCWRRRARS